MVTEIYCWGYIEIPYSRLESYLAAVEALCDRELEVVNFARLVEPPKESYKAAVASFSKIIKPPPAFESDPDIVGGFEFFLNNVGFLTATLLISFGTEKTLFFQYVIDGEKVSKFKNTVFRNNDDYITLNRDTRI